MTFPEFISSEATWLTRLLCRLFGHDCHHGEASTFCLRCGKPLPERRAAALEKAKRLGWLP